MWSRREKNALWREGLEEEIEFWHRWLRDHGEPWGGDYVWRMDPDTELQSRIGAYLPDGADGEPLRIVDVGSGPLTILGKRWQGRRLDITTVDPLGGQYADLFVIVDIDCQAPIAGQAEQLDDVLPADTFDLAFARNCLDHGYDPLEAIRQMLRIVKPGRYVVLDHATDEGEFMGYAGPHQWNFRVEAGRFVIWRPGERIDAHAILSTYADVTAMVATDESRYMSVALRKREAGAG